MSQFSHCGYFTGFLGGFGIIADVKPRIFRVKSPQSGPGRVKNRSSFRSKRSENQVNGECSALHNLAGQRSTYEPPIATLRRLHWLRRRLENHCGYFTRYLGGFGIIADVWPRVFRV